MKISLSILFTILIFFSLHAQPDRWQQHISYNIDVSMNVSANRFTGTEMIDYWNNSPDTLTRLFFHLYWNAFQPNSMMDVRSRELGKTILFTDRNGQSVLDWDPRVRDRISKLTPDEIGYDSVQSITINSISQKLIYHETILEVQLEKPVLPHSKTSMKVSFNAQVPVQIRRSGRDNAEGVRYSMSQWYPKMVEYDYQGWNANPYIAREFYGVWGDYNVNIKIDKSYMIGATGDLINANEIGYGYEDEGVKVKPKTVATLTWKFKAENVHDFVWAADTAFTMIKRKITNGTDFYIIYKKVDSLNSAWKALADPMVVAYPYIEKTFGKYPYSHYSFIQGGDGGMEYPMATLLKDASIGSAIHEFMHSWYQGMMGTNESLYYWMDEGFATYAELRTSAWLRRDTSFPYARAYKSYYNLVRSGREEPMSTHADHFNTNYAYQQASYTKGCIFLSQLGYIVGEDNLDKILLEYYNEWKFKHPNPNDFIRIAEKVSGTELQWYKEYWIYTTKTIDYALGDVSTAQNKATITLKRVGTIPMPIDVLITFRDGSAEMHYIPLDLMYNTKPAETNFSTIDHESWKWVNPEYNIIISHNVSDIKSIEIDPGNRMADINKSNNKIVVP